jgi:hypothetical protein
MREQQFFHGSQAAAAPLPPALDRTAFQIHWREGAGMTIKIRLRRLAAAPKIYPGHLKPDCQPGRNEQLLLDAQVRMVFASMPAPTYLKPPRRMSD